MKIVVILFFVVLSSMFVSADISVSCRQDSDCHLALADDSYFCIDSLCEKGTSDEAVLTLEAKTRDLTWDLIVVQEKKEFCPGDTCLSFAPKNEKETWLSRFIDFFLYL